MGAFLREIRFECMAQVPYKRIGNRTYCSFPWSLRYFVRGLLIFEWGGQGFKYHRTPKKRRFRLSASWVFGLTRSRDKFSLRYSAGVRNLFFLSKSSNGQILGLPRINSKRYVNNMYLFNMFLYFLYFYNKFRFYLLQRYKEKTKERNLFLS